MDVALVGFLDRAAVHHAANDRRSGVEDRHADDEQRHGQSDGRRDFITPMSDIVASVKPRNSAPESPMKIDAG